MTKKKISAEIVADSINSQGDRITTFLLTYPRFIHGELMTHRLFSRNSASSRAIPFKTMIKMVEEDPFIPIAWQKDHKGMQGSEYITDENLIKRNISIWKNNLTETIYRTKILNSECEVTKQLCNRLLEPFMWHTVLVTATEYDNFFNLRLPQYFYEPEELYFNSRKDYLKKWDECFNSKLNLSEEEWWKLSESGAEIHIQALAEAMWDAYNESIPKELVSGQWHIPFGDKIDNNEVYNKFLAPYNFDYNQGKIDTIKIKIAAARCARLSYMTFDGEIDYKKDIKLHDTLLESKHFSPFEHCARCMSDEEYYTFVKGKVPGGVDSIYGIINYEYYPIGFSDSPEYFGLKTVNPYNDDRYGWCNNFKGFIQYRYLIENAK